MQDGIKELGLEFIDHTNEHIKGTDDGVIKCRAIHPRDRETRWDPEASKRLK